MMVEAHYVRQTPVTDPGPHAALFADLPTDVAGLRDLVSELVVHYQLIDPAALGIEPTRREEVNLRTMPAMLSRLHDLQPGPLTAPRPPARRVIGSCRDFTLLLVAMLRHQGIPARSRVGFASYFFPGWFVDHVVAEVWDAATSSWRVVDPQLTRPHRFAGTDAVTGVNPDNITRDQFVIASDAWRRCRAGTADPAQFVVSPFLDILETRGWPQLAYDTMQDLLNLNRTELLLWDEWGTWADLPMAPATMALIDTVAAVTSQPGVDAVAARAVLAHDPALAIPTSVQSRCPVTGVVTPVTIAQPDPV